MTSSIRCRLLATTLFVGASTFSTPLWAQTADAAQEPVVGDDAQATAEATEAVEDIVVTGSRIARPNLEANSPIAVVTGEQLTANADVTLETFLNTLPQANPAATTTSNNPGNQGRAEIDLRGLGSNRNIVLIDGRRPMVSSNLMTVDVNTIPAALIERVDVITGGAGATYGADAISGVVNFILRNNFQGLDLRATYANTGGTDAREFNASAVLGGNFADGRGNAVFAFDYTDRQGLIKSQRAFAAIATSTTTFLPEGFYSTGNNAPSQAAVNAVFAKYGAAAGTVDATTGLSFNTDGTLFATGVFNNPLQAVNFRYPLDLSVNLNLYPDLYSYNFDEVNLLVLPLKRKSFMGKINFEVSSAFEPFAQVGWTRYSSRTALAPTPVPTVTLRNPNDPARTAQQALTNLIVSGQSIANFLVVPTTNPFIPADLRQLLLSRTGDDTRLTGAGGTEPFLMRSRTLGAGARFANFTNEVIQYLGGARGEITDGWRYEAYFSEGRTEITNRGTGAIDTQRLQNLLEAADGGNSLCAGGFNPFGRNPLSPQCITYLEVQTRSQTDLKQRIGQAYVSGELAELPGGTLSAVVGAEIRKFDYAVDPGSLSGPISGPNTVVRAAGRNQFRDFFGELLIPVLRDAPFARSLEVNLSGRISKFKATNLVTGLPGTRSTDETYGVQISYEPIRSVRLRGSYQRAVRAPNFSELFAGGGSAPSYYDPCSVNSQFRAGQLGASTAQALALCQQGHSTGATVTIPATSFASYVQPPGSQLTITLAGNPNVLPEKADTFTVGAVFNAPADTGLLSTLRGSIDYYNIRIQDAIVTPDPNSVLAACFNYLGTNPNFDPSNVNCRSLVRSGSSLITLTNPAAGAGGTFSVNNGAEVKTSGIDGQLSWALQADWLGVENSRINFDLLVSHLLEWQLRDALPGLPFIEYAGTVGYFGQGFTGGGGASFPKWRGTLNTSVSMGETTLNLRTRYIHSMINRASVQYTGETSFTGVPAVWYFDAAVAWNIENMMFRLGVNNLTNKKPPVYAPNVQSGTDPSLYDVIGRRFFATIGLRY